VKKVERTRTRAARSRSAAGRRAPGRLAATVDVVLLAFRKGRLSVLLRPGAGARRELPWRFLAAGEPVARAADGVAREALGSAPAWMEQVRAYDARQRHPGDGDLSLAFVALAAPGDDALGGGGWHPVDALPAIPPRHRAMVDDAIASLRARVSVAPLAFHLLPRTFTLSQLQEVYEVLLGRRLHKASFRRSLQAARLVQPMDEWRSEGRGRPAQLFRYAPARRRSAGQSVRFEFR
jgi:8-oxo-dGTP diphosphatase